jgi:hypothetical protein
MANPAQSQQIQIKADDRALKGNYANMMQVAHSREEFVLDFMNIFPPQGSLVARVITSPGHLKRIIAALAQNLSQYEKQHGNVSPADEPRSEVGFKA